MKIYIIIDGFKIICATASLSIATGILEAFAHLDLSLKELTLISDNN